MKIKCLCVICGGKFLSDKQETVCEECFDTFKPE